MASSMDSEKVCAAQLFNRMEAMRRRRVFMERGLTDQREMAVVGGRRGAFENFGSFDRGDGQFFGGDWNVRMK